MTQIIVLMPLKAFHEEKQLLKLANTVKLYELEN